MWGFLKRLFMRRCRVCGTPLPRNRSWHTCSPRCARQAAEDQAFDF
jgi:predicted nucleic acid-binding Zn ribbon protein